MLDFLLTLSRSDEGVGYRVTLQRGNDGAALSAANATVTALDVERLRTEYLRPLRRFVEDSFPPERLTALGTKLAELLLPPPVRHALFAELLRCPDPAAPVRLRLTVAPSELADVPWEFVYLDPSPTPPRIGEGQGVGSSLIPYPSSLILKGFPCLQPNVHLVRQPRQPLSVPPVAADPLRVLIAWADTHPALPGLEDEVKSILSALRSPECRRVAVDELPHATPAALRRRLGEQPPHMLHFLGHGNVRPTGGVLVLEGAQPDAAEVVYSDKLTSWLAGTPVRVVVLSACLTGASMHSVGAALAAHGVPAVVAMQLPLRDSTAAQFARAFYSTLVVSPSIENAVSQGRQAVQGAGPDWGVPVLYLTSESSDLFLLPDAPPKRPPTNLPYRRNPDFVGREDALAELHGLLHAPERLPVALVGLGGTGKTQAAVEYAHAHMTMTDYPGGVFWLNAANPQRLEHDYAALGGFFDVPSHLPTHERAMLVRDRLQRLTQPSLLIFDNVTEETDLTLLPPGGLCHVLVTTREHYLAQRGFRTLNLPMLDENAALSLLQVRRRAEGGEELAATREIAGILGYLPLALALVAHYVGRLHITFAVYRERIAAARDRLRYLEQARRSFTSHTHHDPSVYNAIALSHRSLTPAAQRVLAAAACFAERRISPDLLLAACDTDATQREVNEEALADLEDHSLVTREEDERLSVHALVRAFALGAMSDEERRAVVGRVAAVFAEHLRQSNEAMDWTSARPEMPHYRAVSELMRADAEPSIRCALWFEMGRYSLEHRDYASAVTCLQDALAAAETAFGGNSPQVAECLRYLGRSEQGAGEGEKAVEREEQALSIAQSALAADDPALANFYNDVGLVLRLQGDLDGALPYYWKALEMNAGAHGRQHPEVAVCLNNIGMVLLQQDDVEAALTHLRGALDIGRTAHGHQHNMVAIYLNNVGQALVKSGDPQEALAFHREALDIYEKIYGHWHIHGAWTHRFIANALVALGQNDDALAHYREALAIFERLLGAGHPRCQELRDTVRRVAESGE